MGLQCPFPIKNFSHIYNNEIVNNVKQTNKQQQQTKYRGQYFSIINKNKVSFIMIHTLILEAGNYRSHHLVQNSEEKAGQ